MENAKVDSIMWAALSQVGLLILSHFPFFHSHQNTGSEHRFSTGQSHPPTLCQPNFSSKKSHPMFKVPQLPTTRFSDSPVFTPHLFLFPYFTAKKVFLIPSKTINAFTCPLISDFHFWTLFLHHDPIYTQIYINEKQVS